MQKQIAKFLFYKYFANINLKNSTIFDIGCGSGFLLQNILQSRQKYNINKIKKFVAVDKSPKMCKITASLAKKSFISYGIYNNSFQNFKPIKQSTNHFLYSSMAFQWMDNIEAAINKAVKMANKICICLPLDESFENIKNVLNKNQIDTLFYKLPTTEQIKQICLMHGLKCSFVNKKYQYKSVVDFFKSIKNIGANLSSVNHDLQNLHTIKFLSKTMPQQPFTSTWKLAIIVK